MCTNKQICLLSINQAISCYRDPNPFFFAQVIMKYILFQHPETWKGIISKRTLPQKFFLDFILGIYFISDNQKYIYLSKTGAG